MRKTTISIIITLSVLSVNSLFSQKDYISKTYYNLKDSIEISLYTDVATERFEIFSDKEQIPNKDVKWIYWTEGVTIECDFPPVYFFSEGTIERDSMKIICYDPTFKRYYTFDQVDQYTLVATKHTALFSKGDTLKMSGIWLQEEQCDLSLSWNGNKRHGIWKQVWYTTDSLRYKYTEYKNDTIIREYSEVKSREQNTSKEQDTITPPKTEIVPYHPKFPTERIPKRKQKVHRLR